MGNPHEKSDALPRCKMDEAKKIDSLLEELNTCSELSSAPQPGVPFEQQLHRLLTFIHTDVVFAVNFRNCPILALEDALGESVPEERALKLIYEVKQVLLREQRNCVRQRQLCRAELTNDHEKLPRSLF